VSVAALDGKSAIVTGAATGIGRATALAFARAGARVTLSDVRAEELERTAAEVRGTGAAIAAVTADLARPDDCAAVVEAALLAAGRLDVLFNNAGVGTMVVGGTVETIDLDRWDLALDVNVRAIYLVSRAAVPAMRRAGGGSIVNTASVSAFRGSATRPSHAYAASKGAVLALTRAMAASYGRDRIRVNAICPGTIRTRLTADFIERAEREAAEGRTIPLGRVGEPEDIARCALFLASDDAAWISGTQIVVDGGALATVT
jgi:NAD(P)-dependent dehydrogenase (short-subunit alcohol dehydrogenase family)